MEPSEPKLIAVSRSVFRCSACDDVKIEIYREKSRKTDAEWNALLQREFKDHIRRRHSGGEPIPLGEGDTDR